MKGLRAVAVDEDMKRVGMRASPVAESLAEIF
jgi:hypothetical protein